MQAGTHLFVRYQLGSSRIAKQTVIKMVSKSNLMNGCQFSNPLYKVGLEPVQQPLPFNDELFGGKAEHR